VFVEVSDDFEELQEGFHGVWLLVVHKCHNGQDRSRPMRRKAAGRTTGSVGGEDGRIINDEWG